MILQKYTTDRIQISKKIFKVFTFIRNSLQQTSLLPIVVVGRIKEKRVGLILEV